MHFGCTLFQVMLTHTKKKLSPTNLRLVLTLCPLQCLKKHTFMSMSLILCQITLLFFLI